MCGTGKPTDRSETGPRLRGEVIDGRWHSTRYFWTTFRSCQSMTVVL